MFVTYALIRLHGGEDFGYQAPTKERIIPHASEMLGDGKWFIVMEITFEGGKVSERRDVTHEIIELAATEALKNCNDTDDADYYGIADWVRETDVYGKLAVGKYSSSEALADRWHDEQIGK